MPKEGAIIRAFELARDGPCQSVTEIKRQLKQEGYDCVEPHFDSASLKRQLNALMKARR